MPADFIKCYKVNKGKVATEKVGKGKYRHVCYDESGRHEGEIKTKKS